MTSQGPLQFPEGAVAIVTGAAAGIGRATAELLLRQGVAVSGWDLAAAEIEALERRAVAAGGRALGLEVDVTNGAAVVAALAQTSERLGPAAFLVNNAGPASTTPLSFVDGLSAALGSMELVTSAWLQTPGAENGHVVNVSSVIGPFVGIRAESWYPAAKAGVAGYTHQLALLRPRGIRANAVAPGLTATGRTREWMRSADARGVVERNPFKRAGTPEDIANAIVFLLAPASEYINGVLLPVDGGSLLTQ